MTSAKKSPDALIEKALAYLKDEKKENAQACVDEALAQDPDHFDAHILASHLLPFGSEEAVSHLAFVMDRNITYYERAKLSDDRRGFVHYFLHDDNDFLGGECSFFLHAEKTPKMGIALIVGALGMYKGDIGS